MTHDVSDTEVEPGNLGGDQPARHRQPNSDGTEAPPGTRVDATVACAGATARISSWCTR